MLKIIYGKSRSGKTTYIYNEIKEKYKENIKKNRQAYLIVPEQFILYAEEKIVNFLDKGGLFNVEVLTLHRMGHYVFNELGLIIDNVTDVEKKIIIYDILNNGQYKLFNAASKGNIENVVDILSEFNRYGVTLENLNNIEIKDERLKDKIIEISNIYEQYITKVKEQGKNYVSEFEILNQYIDKSSALSNCDIYIDEFHEFTKQEYEIILKLSQKNNVTISFCVDSIEISDNPLDIYTKNKAEYFDFINMCKEYDIEYEQVGINNRLEENIKSKEIYHLENNLFAYPYKEYSEKVNDIKICSCINHFVEIENLATMIRKDIQEGYRFSDIRVITRNLEKYADIIWAIFKKYNIPYVLDRNVDIINNQISIVIFSLLDIVIENFSYQSVFSYFKTGFLNVDIDDIYQMENYAIKWEINGNKWNKEFIYDYDIKNEERMQQIELLNNIRKQVVEPLFDFKDRILKCNTTEEIVKEMYMFLADVGIEGAIEEKIRYFEENNMIELKKEYTNVWDYYKELFVQLILTTRDRKIDIVEFKKLLEISFNNTIKSSVPLVKDCVLIGDIEHIRTNEMKVIYFIGAQSDKFPATFLDEGLINDSDREFLRENSIKLAKTTKQNMLLDQFSIYKAITMCIEKITFSYVFNDLSGSSYRPSFLINKIKKMFNLPELVIDDEYLKQNYIYMPISSFEYVFEDNIELLNWYMKNKKEIFEKYNEICNYENNMKICLDKENILSIYSNKLKASISRIEEYVRCPYSFYLKYVLKIKEKEIYAVRSLDIGNFNHQVLEYFFNHIMENNIDIKDLDIDKCNIIVENITNRMFENLNIQAIKYAKEFNILKLKLVRILKKAIWVLVLQIKNSSFKPVGTEVEFGDNGDYHEIKIELDDDKVVSLRGKIDRIDMADTDEGRYVRIIDYKSSSKSIDISDIYNGLNIQLITYLDAVTQKEDNIIPGGILYFKIDNPIIKAEKDIPQEQINAKIVEAMRLEGLFLNDKTLISCMDNNIDKSSKMVNIKLNKEGVATNKNAVSLEEFKELQNEAKNVLKRISEKIFSGDISVYPYWKEKEKYGCKYCTYNCICKFNLKDKNCRYNIMKKF